MTYEAWDIAWDSLFDAAKQIVFITGPAGSGKSKLVNDLISHTRSNREAPQNIAVVAPTGVAAINVGGMTVHKFFNFPIDVSLDRILSEKIKPFRREQYLLYRHLEHLIIDEASMLRSDLLDCIDAYLRMYGADPLLPFGGVKITFVGDFYQLQPVVTHSEQELFSTQYQSAFFFDAHALRDVPMYLSELTEIFRQHDIDFKDLLNRFRQATHSGEDIEKLNGRLRENLPQEWLLEHQDKAVFLTSHRKRAEFINQRQLDKLQGESREFKAEINGKFPTHTLPSPECLKLKIGCKVMLLTNDAGYRWYNGSIGVVQQFTVDENGEDALQIELQDGSRVTVTSHTWDMLEIKYSDGALNSSSVGSYHQFPVNLAWACTIHKAQGLKFDNVIMDLSTGVFSAGQVYVALSRCTTLEGIVLTQRLRSEQIYSNDAMEKLKQRPALECL